MITIGPYCLYYETIPPTSKNGRIVKEMTYLRIDKDDGESGTGSFDEKKLIEMLDQFWKEQF